MKMKKYLAIALIVLMAMTSTVGCSTTPTKLDTSKSSGPVTITLLTMESDSQWSFASTPNFKAIQAILLKKFNVNYQLETALSKDFETTVSTRFASGGKLPDIVDWGYSIDKLLALYGNGMIIKLNDLVDKYAPDIQALYKIRPFVKVSSSDNTGNIMRIPDQYMDNPQQRITVMTIRNDWLKKIGKTYADIKTPDDYYNALKAFQDKDVNGNGKKDEILTSIGIPTLNIVFSTAFGVKNMSDAANSWYPDSNGKIYSTMLGDGVKDYVTYMNKLYKEKLLDNNFMNQTGDQYNQKAYNNQIAGEAGPWWDSVCFNTPVRDKGFKDAELIPLVPSISANGAPFVNLKDLTGYGGMMITKDCKDPAAAMKVLNWGYTLEGSQMDYYGESGDGGNYYKKSVSTDGLKLADFSMTYTDKGTKAMAAEPLLWNKMGWNCIFMTKCLIGTGDDVASEFKTSFANAGLAADVQFNSNGLKDCVGKYGSAACDFATPTIAQSDTMTKYSDLFTYMDEEISKFITGADSISNWDAFVTKCKSMGIDNATAVKQQEYDSYKAIIK